MVKPLTFDPDASPSFDWVRLVKIYRNNGTVLRIADVKEPLTVAGDIWYPIPGCSISAVREVANGDEQSMQIDFAHSVAGVFDTEALLFHLYDFARVEHWIVDRRNPPSDLGTLKFFVGRVGPVTVAWPGAGSLDIRSVKEQNVRKGRTFQPMCDTWLFSPLCQLHQGDFAQGATVGAFIDEHNITVSGLAALPGGFPDWYDLGKGYTASGIKFEIARYDEGTATLTTFLPKCGLSSIGVIPGDSITLFPGCGRTMSICKTKFGNNLNFQGWPHFLGAAAMVTGG